MDLLPVILQGAVPAWWLQTLLRSLDHKLWNPSSTIYLDTWRKIATTLKDCPSPACKSFFKWLKYTGSLPHCFMALVGRTRTQVPWCEATFNHRWRSQGTSVVLVAASARCLSGGRSFFNLITPGQTWSLPADMHSSVHWEALQVSALLLFAGRR